MTEEFDGGDFQKRHQGEAIPMFLLSKDGLLKVYTTDHKPEPEPGETLISLVRPDGAREEQPRQGQRATRGE